MLKRTSLISVSLLAFAGLAASIAACTTVLTPRVRISSETLPKRVVLVPATCTALAGKCDPADLRAIEEMVTSELEFSGLQVVGGRSLVADTRSRDEAGGAVAILGTEVIAAGSKQQSGSLFADLSPAKQRALIAEANADGVVLVDLARRKGETSGLRHVVTVRLRGGDELGPVWVSECSALSSWGGNPGYPDATASATKCALSGVLKSTENPPAKCATIFCSGD